MQPFKYVKFDKIHGSFRFGVEYMPRYRELYIDMIWWCVNIKLK